MESLNPQEPLFYLCQIITKSQPKREPTNKWFVTQDEYKGNHTKICNKYEVMSIFLEV